MNTSISRRRTLARAVLASALGLAVLLSGAVLQPAAAVEGPAGLAPAGGETVSGIPVFTWDRLAGATAYDAEIYDGATKLTSVTNTVNFQWVPNSVELPTGKPLTWRVRGAVNGVESDWSTESFTRDAVNAPQLLSPDNGEELSQPGEPLVYRWEAVPGAVDYTIERSLDQGFVDPAQVTKYTTKATMYAPNAIPVDQTYYWRVIANLKSGSSRRTHRCAATRSRP